jgi:hypothetical protein
MYNWCATPERVYTMSSNHYVNNKDLYNAIVKYKDDCIKAKKQKKPKPPIPEYVGKCILLIAQRLSTSYKFANYSFVDDMISDGVENCISYFDNFDPSKYTNPFAYFTQIIYYAFLRRILKERKQQYIKHKALENSMLFDELVHQGENDDGFTVINVDIDNQHVVDFIKTFEDNIKDKKAKKKKKKGLENFLEG